MNRNSTPGRDRATVTRSRLTSQAPAPPPINPLITPGGAGTSSQERLHEARVAWGKLWGARISEATRRWKEEID